MTMPPAACTREIRFAQLSLAATLICLAGTAQYFGERFLQAVNVSDWRTLTEIAIFTLALGAITHSNLLYHICLIGHYRRTRAHRAVAPEKLEAVYDAPAPKMSIIIPAYKEERSVNWQTMLSAALSEYPEKNVVLLIDDPYRPKALEDILKLEDTRKIPGEMQAEFDAMRAEMLAAQTGYLERLQTGSAIPGAELNRIATLYEAVADWLEAHTGRVLNGRRFSDIPHADRFFIEAILQRPARAHLLRAKTLRAEIHQPAAEISPRIAREYARLVGLFTVRFSSFERKHYVNLSHESNKAMNLNSYIGLIGKSWREVETPHGLTLRECSAEHASFTIPHADYVNTIDSDSLMLSDYVLRLSYIMERPGNEKLAVIQSPCSAFPGSKNMLERIAGACIDVQFRTHQGYTYWGASFWVGANAMLRRAALEEIRETRFENGHAVSIYIQDRTVIEDTESTIDLVEKGWKLWNYPERMTFSATPPDFGSLLIQRRRWSNGGLIILPKLLAYAWKAKKDKALAKEMFMRFHYLASTTSGVMAGLLLMFYPFADVLSTPWMGLSALPLLALYARDLKNTDYRASDVFRICAFNLMLFPVALGGVLKQFQQMVTRKKIPFGRTPKITGRTAAPAFYCALEIAMPLMFAGIAADQIIMGNAMHAGFAALNAALLTYALVALMGLRATFEDILAPFRARISAAKTLQSLPENAGTYSQAA